MKYYAIIQTSFDYSTVGPYDTEEKRDQAVRDHLQDQSADSGDELMFAELEDDGQLEVYGMEIDEFLPEDEDEEDEAE